MQRTLGRTITTAVLASGIVLGSSAAALAETPPGQRGHEGQPGNQGGH